MRSCAPYSWDPSGKGQEVMYKISSQYVKILKFSFLEGHFLGIVGSGGLDCSQYQILTDPGNSLKNLCTNFWWWSVP